MKQLRHISITTTGLVLAASAQAQVVYATDDAVASENFYHDVVAATNTGPLWTGAEAWGMGDDDLNSVMYINDGTSLYTWPYNDPNPATLAGTFTIAATGAALAPTYLAYTNGFLYGGTNINVEGVYEIDVVTQMATLVFAFPSAADIDIGGFDVDPATGLFYGSNDDSTHPGGGLGIIEIDVVGMTETFIAAYPAGETDIDGLAFDPAGVVYLLEDEPAPLHNYDLVTMTYDPAPPMNAIPNGALFSAGTYTAGPDPGGAGPIGAPDPNCITIPNSIGTIPVVSLVGTGNAGDDVAAQLTDGIPNEFGYWISGPNSGILPSGCGILCIGNPLFRYTNGGLGHIFQFDAAGVSQVAGGSGPNTLATDGSFAPVPAVVVGETRGFVGWYRDPGCTVAGLAYNFSGAVLVTFQ